MAILGMVLVTLLSITAEAKYRFKGWAQAGSTIVTSGVTSTSKALKVYPSSTVTVYLAGTSTPATIYSDNGGTPKANPFTAGSDGSFQFYADLASYDVRFSGTGIDTPFTEFTPALLESAVADTDTRLPAASPVLFCDRYAGADFGAKLTAAIAALPSTGGIIDCRMLTGAQSLSSSVTINKVNTTILLGPMTLTMGSYQFIVPVDTTSVSIIGQGGGAAANAAGSGFATAGTLFTYSGTTFAILVGATTDQTWWLSLKDLSISVSANAGGGINVINVVHGSLERLGVRHTTPASSTGAGIKIEAGAGTGTTYAAFNDVIDPGICNFKTGVLITGAGAFSANVNRVVRGNICGASPIVSGSIAVDIANGEGNLVQDVDIEAFDVGVKVRNGAKWNSVRNVTFDGNSGYLVDVESGANNNDFSYHRVNGGIYRDLGADNSFRDDRLMFGFDGTFSFMRAGTALPLAIKSADGGFRFKVGDLDNIVQAGDNGGNGILWLNKETGRGGVRIGDGQGNLKFLFDPGGFYAFGGVTFASLGASSNGYSTYCTDCNVVSAAPHTCTSGGSGAWAFRNGGAWKCPF